MLPPGSYFFITVFSLILLFQVLFGEAGKWKPNKHRTSASLGGGNQS